MNTTAIKILKAVIGGVTSSKELQSRLGVSTSQVHAQIRELASRGFVDRTGSDISLQKNAKAQLIKKISQAVDIERILRGSNERVFCCLTCPSTVAEIVARTGLSHTSVSKAISDFKAVGIARMMNNSKPRQRIRLALTGSQDLASLANIMNIEQEARHAEVEIIYQDAARVLKRCTKNQRTTGRPTAFSMFGEHGIAYDDPFDYYIAQDKPVDIHEITIHAVVVSYQAQNRMGLLMAIIFYLRNRRMLDTVRLRKIAQSYGVDGVWLDIESYVRHKKPVKNTKLFLPWSEFVEKAEIYEISLAEFQVPAATGLLFDKIGMHSTRLLEVYLLGGENMRIKNLKAATKDCDVVVRNKADFDRFVDIMTSRIGFEKLADSEHTQDDMRLCPGAILVHPDMPRVDVFTSRILNGAVLSDAMVQTANYLNYGNLRVGVLRSEYVFLLKAVAGREGDIDDMEILAKNPSKGQGEFDQGRFAWEVVWDEIVWQDMANPVTNLVGSIFEQVSHLAEQRNVIVPILGRIRLRAVDREIKRILRGGRMPLRDVVSFLVGSDTDARLIRNRIESLVRQGKVTKQTIPVATTLAAAADEFLGWAIAGQGSIKQHTISVVSAIAANLSAATEDLYPLSYGRGAGTKYADRNMVAISGPEEHFPYEDRRLDRKNVDEYLTWRFPVREPSDLAGATHFVDELARAGYRTIADIDEAVASNTDAILSRIDGHHPYRLNQVTAAKICLEMA